MSLFTHLAILAILVVDLVLGATVIERFLGRGPAIGFEFVIILGYLLFILQWGPPWGRRKGGDS